MERLIRPLKRRAVLVAFLVTWQTLVINLRILPSAMPFCPCC
jgi:hypothetical protein